MVPGLPWKLTVTQEISCFYGTQISLSGTQRPASDLWLLLRVFVSFSPTSKLEYHPLSAVHELFNILAATLRIWRPSLEGAPWRGDKGPT
jgi:hypothetical protein